MEIVLEKKIERIDNVLYGPKIDIPLDEKGLGRTIFEKMIEYNDRISQIDPKSNDIQTYEEVNRKCVRIALEMKRRNVQTSDVILICSGRNMDSHIVKYATLYLNAITVTLDPLISLIDAVHLLKTISPKCIFATETSVGLIENSLAQLEILPKIVVMGSHSKYPTLNEFLRPHPDEEMFVPNCVGDIERTAVIFFSSGTTGLPKAVCFSHRSILNACITASFDRIDCTTSLHFTSLHHIAAFIFSTAVTLLGGKRIVTGTFTPEIFLKYVQNYNVTFSTLLPSYALQFNKELTRNYKTDSLAEMQICGNIATPEQMKYLFECFPSTHIYTLYGQTETNIIATFSKCYDSLSKTKFGSSGVPFTNSILKIADIRTGRTLGPYEKGEVRVINDYTFTSFYNTNCYDCFDNEGFLKTGDIGYYDEDNCVYCCGRLKESFRYRDWCIVPSFIEKVIYKHPAVLEAIVIGMPHETDYYHPLALIVLKDGYDITEEELLSFINEKLLDSEKLRAGVRIVRKLPKTCTGKIPRQVIRQMLLTGNFNRFYK